MKAAMPPGGVAPWCVGKLQTDEGRERIVDGLALGDGDGETSREMGARIQHLAPRWFVMRNAHSGEGPVLLQPRWAMSFLRGPLTRVELGRAIEARRARRREAVR